MVTLVTIEIGLLCVLQIAATAVCHTDLYHLLENMHKDGFPTVLGHEAAGVVESVGPGVTEYQPGQIRMGQRLEIFGSIASNKMSLYLQETKSSLCSSDSAESAVSAGAQRPTSVRKLG